MYPRLNNIKDKLNELKQKYYFPCKYSLEKNMEDYLLLKKCSESYKDNKTVFENYSVNSGDLKKTFTFISNDVKDLGKRIQAAENFLKEIGAKRGKSNGDFSAMNKTLDKLTEIHKELDGFLTDLEKDELIEDKLRKKSQVSWTEKNKIKRVLKKLPQIRKEIEIEEIRQNMKDRIDKANGADLKKYFKNVYDNFNEFISSLEKNKKYSQKIFAKIGVLFKEPLERKIYDAYTHLRASRNQLKRELDKYKEKKPLSEEAKEKLIRNSSVTRYFINRIVEYMAIISVDPQDVPLLKLPEKKYETEQFKRVNK